jgi:hypothetical protein
MFNSDHLSEHYKVKASSIQPPVGHERHVRQLFEQSLANQGSIGMQRRSAFTVFATMAVIIAVLSGFTGYYFLKINDQRVSIHYKQSLSDSFDAGMAAAIYDKVAEVKSKLSLGESAVLYVPALADKFPHQKGLSLLPVSRPFTISDFEEWQNTFESRLGHDGLAASALGNWTFEYGQLEPPYGGTIQDNMDGLLKDLQAESLLSGGAPAWTKVQSNGEASNVYTAFYHNENQTELYITMTIIEEKTEFRLISSLSEAEELGLPGINAHYLRTEPFMLSSSNQVQTVDWLESYDDYTLMYGVGSTSPEMTKEELLGVVAELVGQ